MIPGAACSPRPVEVQLSLWEGLRFGWVASRGYRLRPWASPYVRWRLETFFGGDMERLTAREFGRLVWQNRRRLASLLRWSAQMRRWMK